MRYAEPSIIEALCEFVFVPELPWNGSGFERFGDVMAARLPVREQRWSRPKSVVEFDYRRGALG